MMAQQKTWLNLVVGLLAGLVGSLALAALWHLFGGASPRVEAGTAGGNPFTEYFLECLSWPFAAAHFVLSIVLGSIVRRAWPVALGMMLPLPIAVWIEVSWSLGSHNLFPFEALLYWLPAFGLALLGGYLGKIIGVRLARKGNALPTPAVDRVGKGAPPSEPVR